MKHFAEIIEKAGVSYEPLVVAGDAAEVIVEEARARD